MYDWCLKQWLQDENEIDEQDKEDSDLGILEQETLKYAASVLLTQFLQDESTSEWLYSMPEGQWWIFTERLLEQSQRLLDPNMPMTAFARLSLTSLHLLAIIQRKSGKEMPHGYEKLLTGNGNGGLILEMTQSILNVAVEAGPRWAVDSTMWILPILQEWIKSGSLITFWETECRSESARTFAREVTEKIRDGSLIKPTRLVSFLWLMRETPALCRSKMLEVIPNDRWADFLEVLATSISRENACTSIIPTAVLRQVLFLTANRKLDSSASMKSHHILKTLLVKAAATIKHKDEKALLLLLLDCIRGLISNFDRADCNHIRDFVEHLLPIISPEMQQIAGNTIHFDADSSMDSDGSTPPANNLSRIDLSAILPDESTTARSEMLVYGLECCIRISAATLLAAAINSADYDHMEFQTQASQILSEFISSSEMLTPAQDTYRISFSVVLRRAHLMRILAMMHDEGCFFDVLVNAENNRLQAYSQSRKEALHLRKRVEWLEQREKHLSQENSSLQSQLEAQMTSAQRQCNILHRKLSNEARQSLKTEIAQRTVLQREVECLRENAKEIQSRLRVQEDQNSSMKCHVERLKNELDEKSKSLELQNTEVQELKRERDCIRDQLATVSRELEAANVDISSYKKREHQLREQVAQNEEDLEALEASRSEMHANLESLFGDMVSLAHAFKLKEKEVSSGHESKEAVIEKLEHDLDRERQRRKDLEDKYRQVEYENEALSRKYARAREKLEEERKQRSQAQASQASSRRGDTSKSYIQQLQISTSRSSSHSGSRYGKENEPTRSTRRSKIR